MDRSGRYSFAQRLAVCGLFALLLTAVMLQYSFRHGRLIFTPMFDDVTYTSDAARRVALLYLARPGAFLRDYAADPPHSPYSSGLAMVSFLIFGIREWPPYVINALLALVYFLFADYLLRALAMWQRVTAMLLLALIPLTANAVVEFRPDHACSLFTVIGCFLILEKPLARMPVRRLVLIGATFGLALLAKPPTSPATGLLLPTCLLMRAVADRFILRPRTCLLWGRVWGLPLLVAVLVALPHYAVAIKPIGAYIHYIMFGDGSRIWVMPGSFVDHATYYLSGPGAKIQFGRSRDLLLIAPIVAAGCLLFRRRRVDVVRLILFTCLLLGTWAMVTANRVKSDYFGLNFQTAVVMTVIASIGVLLRGERLQRSRYPILRYRPFSIGLVLLTAAFAMRFQWPTRMSDVNSEMAINRREIVNGVYQSLLSRNPSPGALVLIEGVSEASEEALRFFAIRDGHNLRFDTPPDPEPLEQQVKRWNDADFIVLSERGTLVTADFLHTYKLLDQMKEQIDRRAEWRVVSHHIYRPSGRGIYLYERVKP